MDDRLTREQIEQCASLFNLNPKAYPNGERNDLLRKLCDLALSALRQDSSGGVLEQEPVAWRREWDGDVSDIGHILYVEDAKDRDDPVSRWQPLYATPQESRSEVLDQSQADAVLHAHKEICDLFAQNSGDYDPSPDEVDQVHDGLIVILGNIAAAFASRAEPGAQQSDESVHPKALDEAETTVHFPNDRELGEWNDSANAAEQDNLMGSEALPRTLGGPDVTSHRPDEKPASAATQPDMTDYDRGLRNGRARGLAEGLQIVKEQREHAVIEAGISGDLNKGTDKQLWKFAESELRYIEKRIRAKIKPAKGEL